MWTDSYSRVDELSEVSKEPDEVLEILVSTPSSTICILPSEVIDFVGSWVVCEAVVFEDVLLEEGIEPILVDEEGFPCLIEGGVLTGGDREFAVVVPAFQFLFEFHVRLSCWGRSK